jgi:O-acetyl-ADP-ribose deacetylase
MKPALVKGNLINQDVDVIVNAWNRNAIPWWLLLPQGVSGAIKRAAGIAPFVELGRLGLMPLGSAVRTSSGRLPYRSIIHVAGINLLWRASTKSIRDSARSAMQLVNQDQDQSVAFPVIGAGSGGFNQEKALQVVLDAFDEIETIASVLVVLYEK